MPRLDCYKNRDRIITVKLREDSILIGRSSECDLQLPTDAVSRQHARILKGAAGDHLIEDLSTNGTRVNAKVIDRRALLAPGDRIYIGDYVLIYQPDEAPVEKLEKEDPPTVYMRRPPGLEG